MSTMESGIRTLWAWSAETVFFGACALVLELKMGSSHFRLTSSEGVIANSLLGMYALAVNWLVIGPKRRFRQKQAIILFSFISLPIVIGLWFVFFAGVSEISSTTSALKAPVAVLQGCQLTLLLLWQVAVMSKSKTTGAWKA